MAELGKKLEFTLIDAKEVPPAERTGSTRKSPILTSLREIPEDKSLTMKIEGSREEQDKIVNSIRAVAYKQGNLTWKPKVQFNREKNTLFITRKKGSDYMRVDGQLVHNPETERPMTVAEYEAQNK